jgi:ribosome modulation factor
MSALDRAVEKGRAAFHTGIPIDECPYPDHRNEYGRITWSRAFRIAWIDGWEEERSATETWNPSVIIKDIC